MSKKIDLEKELSRLSEPAPGRSLRRRTLAQLGLKAGPGMMAQAGLALALALGAGLVWRALPKRDSSPQISRAAPAPQKQTEIRQQLAASPLPPKRRAAGQVLGQAASAQPPAAAQLAGAVSDTAASLPQAPAPGPDLPASPAPAASPPGPEVPQFGFSGHEGGGSQASAAALEKAGAGAKAAHYSFKVKLNKFRPGQGERLGLEITLEAPQICSLQIFDARGQEVAKPLDGPLPQGQSNLNWDGGILPSGAYTVIFRAGQKTERTAVLLVR